MNAFLRLLAALSLILFVFSGCSEPNQVDTEESGSGEGGVSSYEDYETQEQEPAAGEGEGDNYPG